MESAEFSDEEVTTLYLDKFKTLRSFKDQIEKLRRADVEEVRIKIEEARDIECKIHVMHRFIEENVPASVNLLERLLMESEREEPVMHLEWLLHRPHVSNFVETLEKAKEMVELPFEKIKFMLQRTTFDFYYFYIKACVNFHEVSKYYEEYRSFLEDFSRTGFEGLLISFLELFIEKIYGRKQSTTDNPSQNPESAEERDEVSLSEIVRKVVGGEYPLKKVNYDESLPELRTPGQANLEDAQDIAKLNRDPSDLHLLQILKGDLLLAKRHISEAIDTVFKPLLKEPHLSLKNKGILFQKLGNACRFSGRLGLAKYYLRRSIKIAQIEGDRVSEYNRIADLGNVYRSEGRIADALKHHEAHMAFAFKRGDLRGLSTACLNMCLANFYSSRRPDLKKVQLLLSLHLFDMSRLLTDEPAELWHEKIILEKFGKTSCDDPLDGSQSFPEKPASSPLLDAVLEYMKDTCMGSKMDIKLALKLWNLKLETKTFSSLGSAYRYHGNSESAVEFHKNEVEFAQAVGDKELMAIMQRELAKDYLVKGDYDKAEEQAKAAISTQEMIREELGGKDTSKIANFDKNESETYSLLQIILCQREKYTEALAVCELGRSRALADLIRKKLTRETRQPRDDCWIYNSDFVYRWQDRVKDIQIDFLQSADELCTNFLVYSVITEYDDKENARYFLYMWLVLNEKSAKGGKDRIHFRKMALSEKIQSELLVDYGFFSKLTRSFADQAEDGAFSVSKIKEALHEKPAVDEKFKYIRMPEGPEVEELFKALGFRPVFANDEGKETSSSDRDPQGSNASKQKLSIKERISEPGSWADEGRTQLYQLYDLCVSPVEHLLPEEEQDGPVPSITVLPHEFLFGVPFCCLKDGSGKDQRHLVERFAISYAPSLLVLRLLNKRLLQLRTKQGSRRRKVLAMGHPVMSYPTFRELPNSGKEATAVQEVFGAEDCFLALREDATKQLMLQELQNVDILHVATHASPQNIEDRQKKPMGDYSMRGCILLSESDDDCDGMVTASEIASVDCKCQLVTLSCCETGLGKVTGDGVVGLNRALFAAGAASVIVTLWKIRDDVTRLFMEHFYKDFKRTGNVSRSLRNTMVYCIREKKLPPQQWAAFSHIGATL